MLKAQPSGGFGDALWFVGSQGSWSAAIDRAKSAGAGADGAKDHEGGRFLGVTLHPVRTFGVVANRFQAEFFEQPGSEVAEIAFGHLALQPTGQATRFLGGRRCDQKRQFKRRRHGG